MLLSARYFIYITASWGMHKDRGKESTEDENKTGSKVVNLTPNDFL